LFDVVIDVSAAAAVSVLPNVDQQKRRTSSVVHLMFDGFNFNRCTLSLSLSGV
jgi:hypothetical protein